MQRNSPRYRPANEPSPRLGENQEHERMRIHHALILSVAVLLGGGCAHYPENARLKHYDPQSGYRFRNLSNTGNSDSLQLFLSFSGGGTRPAALSYGVLDFPRRLS